MGENSFHTLAGRLYCTFSKNREIEDVLDYITSNYDVLFNKIYILVSPEDEYIFTYNIENPANNTIIPNTILVHRNKLTNSLYTINALNELVKSLNNGNLDVNFKINWNEYRNCILLTNESQLKQIKTKLFKIQEI